VTFVLANKIYIKGKFIWYEYSGHTTCRKI
jgi:hypothetical protein